MIIVTGAAGFIGSCILARLNEMGRIDVDIVDQIDEGDVKKANLNNKRFRKFYNRNEFIKLIRQDRLDDDIECIIHMGACSSTTLTDAKYYLENNYEYTRSLAEWALERGVRFIYASSAATYGDGSNGYKDDEETIAKCQPLNLYGKSKQDFDLWVLQNGLIDQVVGLKYFNVFGPNEYHKADMRSVVAKAYEKVVKEGKMQLFKSYRKEYADGEQKRDFIYVKDAVDMTLYFYEKKDVNGIFNVGTGKARSWNDLARALFSAVGKKPNIEYIEMPEKLKSQYQYFTEADMTNMRRAGYKKAFTELEPAIKNYVGYLRNYRCL